VVASVAEPGLAAYMNLMGLLLLIVLLLVVVGGLPNLGFHRYGYAPSGIGGVLLAVVAVLLLTGRL
jgi:Protein of unknown function (DUF3309)